MISITKLCTNGTEEIFSNGSMFLQTLMVNEVPLLIDFIHVFPIGIRRHAPHFTSSFPNKKWGHDLGGNTISSVSRPLTMMLSAAFFSVANLYYISWQERLVPTKKNENQIEFPEYEKEGNLYKVGNTGSIFFSQFIWTRCSIVMLYLYVSSPWIFLLKGAVLLCNYLVSK